MVILVVHNFYLQAGGEDQVYAAETALLEEHGHEVLRYTLSNRDVGSMNRAALAATTLWNDRVYRELRHLIRSRRPQVMHVHNTLPLISPAAYYAAKAEGVAVVQTLHNYRLFCPNGLFFRDDRVCLDCAQKTAPWPAVMHACYRNSRSATATVASMLTLHRALGTYRDAVDCYVALTSFSRDLFVDCGLPSEKITVKPNFMHPDPGESFDDGGFALFVGRLSREKGVVTLLDALERLGGCVPARIVGDGPLASEVKRAAAKLPGLSFFGAQPLDVVCELIGQASFLVVPSLWFENFPRVLVEAFARGTPVIAAEIGALVEIVEQGRNGFLFPPGDAAALADRIEHALCHPQELARMRVQARNEFESKYSAESGYQKLMEIYHDARARAAVAE